MPIAHFRHGLRDRWAIMNTIRRHLKMLPMTTRLPPIFGFLHYDSDYAAMGGRFGDIKLHAPAPVALGLARRSSMASAIIDDSGAIITHCSTTIYRCHFWRRAAVASWSSTRRMPHGRFIFGRRGAAIVAEWGHARAASFGFYSEEHGASMTEHAPYSRAARFSRRFAFRWRRRRKAPPRLRFHYQYRRLYRQHRQILLAAKFLNMHCE